MKFPEYQLADLLITLENGGRPAGGVSSIARGIPSVGGEHLNADGGFDFSNVKYVPEEYFQNMRRGHIKPDDILIVKDGATTGKVSFVTQDFPFKEAAVNEHVFILRVNKEKVLSRFLFYYLFSPLGQERVLANYRGAAIGGINQSFTQNTIVPIPPLPQQERIVRLLDEAESLRATRARANTRMEQFVPALFHEMFGDPAINSKKWTTITIGKITSLVTSGSTPKGGSNVYVDTGPYFIRSQNVQMNKLDFSDIACLPLEIHEAMQRTKIQKDDVLLNITGASIGRVSWVDSLDREANVNQHVCVIRLNKTQAIPEYVSVCISTPYGQRLIDSVQSGASRQGLNHQQVKQMVIPLPPLALQREFAARVGEARGVQSAQVKSAEKIEALYQSMLSQAFAGEL